MRCCPRNRGPIGFLIELAALAPKLLELSEEAIELLLELARELAIGLRCRSAANGAQVRDEIARLNLAQLAAERRHFIALPVQDTGRELAGSSPIVPGFVAEIG